MKKAFFYLAAVAAVLVSCDKKEIDEAPVRPQEADYVGTVTVTFRDTDYDNENISVNFIPNEKGDSASVTIHQIRFVPQMPVTIDITIPGITLSSTDDKVTLSGDSIVPRALGGSPYPRYTVTGLNGELKGNDLSFSLKFGDYPTSFRGIRQTVTQ